MTNGLETRGTLNTHGAGAVTFKADLRSRQACSEPLYLILRFFPCLVWLLVPGGAPPQSRGSSIANGHVFGGSSSVYKSCQLLSPSLPPSPTFPSPDIL